VGTVGLTEVVDRTGPDRISPDDHEHHPATAAVATPTVIRMRPD
jgi:hypothetical protein